MCNFCSYNWIKSKAAADGFVVTKIKSSFMRGWDIFVHPKDINLKKLEGINILGHPNRNKYFVAWFMEIPPKHVS